MEEVNVKQEVVNKIYNEISTRMDLVASCGDESEEQRLLNGICKLADKVVAIEANDYEYFDKMERREIERERNEKMAQLEKEKQKMDWKRFALEAGKIGVPIVTVLIAAAANKEMQAREHKFDGANLIHTGFTWRKFNPFMRT